MSSAHKQMENLQPTNYCNRYEKIKVCCDWPKTFFKRERIPRESREQVWQKGNPEKETDTKQEVRGLRQEVSICLPYLKQSSIWFCSHQRHFFSPNCAGSLCIKVKFGGT